MSFRKLMVVLLLLTLGGVGLAEERKIPTAPDFEFDFPKVPELQSFFQGYEKDLRDEMNQEFDKAKAEGDIYNPWSLSAGAKVTYKGKFWTVMVNGYDYRGGAHGIPILDAVYFSPQSFEEVSQDALFEKNAYEILSRWSREGLVKQGFDKTDDWMLEGTAPKPENFQLVVPGEGGVEVIFSSYQVAPYAAGTPSVEIPWSEARAIFKEAYRP